MKRHFMFKVLLTLLVSAFLSVDAFAQQITVKGLVKDGTGEPVIGANVLVKGTTNGTITDFDGNFSLSDVKKGDVIVAVDSVKVMTPSSVQEVVSRFSPGDNAVVTVLRDGKELKLDVTFKGTSQDTGTVSVDGSIAFYGSSIKAADEETLERFGLKSGVQIVELGPGKLMEAGAVEGFIILYVNDHPVKTPQEVIDIVKKSKRTVFIEGVTPSGRTGYFGFGV